MEPSKKSTWAQCLAAEKIDEEFAYFRKVYETLGPESFERTIHALLYALNPAKKGLLDTGERVTKLPAGSKVCIMGAGMSGMY